VSDAQFVLPPPILLGLAFSSATAFELKWDGTVPSPHSEAAQVCTLSVWTSPVVGFRDGSFL
jgi:hypothetical protein